MNVLDFLKGNFRFHAGSIGGQWTLTGADKPWRSKSWFGGSTAAGIPVNHDTALNSAAAFACTRAIAETLATLPAVVYENMEADQRQKARDNPMWSLLHDQPNPEMDSVTWYSLNAKRVVNRGNALNLIEYNGRGLPVALWPIHNSRWEARRGRSELMPNSMFKPGPLYYRVWPDDTARFVDVSPEDVLNVVGFDTENGIVARGVVSRLRQEIGLDIAEQEYAGSMFGNGALPLGLIKHPFLSDDDQRANLRSDINSMHTGRENWNKVGFLWDKDADWIPLNFNPKDVQAVESRQLTAKTICRGYNVPPAIVQIFDDYKFSTVEAMLKQFVMLTIRPYAVTFERAIKSQLLNDIPGPDVFLEFALEGLLRGDPKAQAETNAILRQWGIINADEWRQRDMNLNPLPDGLGEAYLGPMNYTTLDKIVNPPEPPPQRTPPPFPPMDDDEDDDEEAGAETSGKPRWSKSHLAAMIAATRGNGRHYSFRSEPDEVEQYAWEIMRRQTARMIANEQRAIRRTISSKDATIHGVTTWAEQYYERFSVAMADALNLASDGVCAANIGERLAALHCAESKRLLAAAVEESPEKFREQIEACIADWPQRAERIGYERAAA